MIGVAYSIQVWRFGGRLWGQPAEPSLLHHRIEVGLSRLRSALIRTEIVVYILLHLSYRWNLQPCGSRLTPHKPYFIEHCSSVVAAPLSTWREIHSRTSDTVLPQRL